MNKYMSKTLPQIDHDQLMIAAKIMVVACINTNADTMTLTQEKFHDPEGNLLGDFEIVVKKLKSK